MLAWSGTLAPIAQGIERLPPEQKAVGSNPTGGTTFLIREPHGLFVLRRRRVPLVHADGCAVRGTARGQGASGPRAALPLRRRRMAAARGQRRGGLSEQGEDGRQR